MVESILERFVGLLAGGVMGESSSLNIARSGEWARLNDVDGVIALGDIVGASDMECPIDRLDLETEEGPRAR
jgi:hypothetical protein